MIKHRFILRSWSEAQIFAAIPTEHQTLMWRAWSRSTDWSALRDDLRIRWRILEHIHDTTNDVVIDLARSRSQRELRRDLIEWTRRFTVEALHTFSMFLRIAEQESANWAETVTDLERMIVDTRLALEAKVLGSVPVGLIDGILGTEIGDVLSPMSWLRIPTGNEICPEGVPFPFYAVEIPHRPHPGLKQNPTNRLIVNIIEGMASAETVNGHDPFAFDWIRDTSQMAVEMVTQMLVERKINPRAETNIRVDTVNHPKAQEILRQEAEEEIGARPPRMKSIKFEVSPPRYLREAAERILRSHVRAHWVMGHWRNQPCGTGHALRRQTWIAPHIRGLGEAGATLAKVSAPRHPEDVAER